MKTSPVHQKWIIFFGIWLVLLSGGLAKFVGSPGALQAIRLQKLLKSKQAQVEQVKQDIFKLHTDARQLEQNRHAQIREIRRVLGYLAADELIFDFTHTPD